jgi:deazaflavin-dependent oxidoreductase (nitroreductase family)
MAMTTERVPDPERETRAKAVEPECLYLTTSGRRSGQPREIELWFTRHGGRYYLIAEHRWETHWVQNLVADPRVRVRVGHEDFRARARVVDADVDPEAHAAAQARSERKYGWGDGLVVELSPEEVSAAAAPAPSRTD